MIVASLLFFPPDLPRRIWRDVTGRHPFWLPALLAGFTLGAALSVAVLGRWVPVPMLAGGAGLAVAFYSLPEVFRPRASGHAIFEHCAEMGGAKGPGLTGLQKLALVAAGLWILVQVSLPLRHFVIPGNVSWTEEGLNFAWHMLLRSKRAEGYFVVVDRTSGEEWVVEPGSYLTDRQTRGMISRPHLIVQFAHGL